MAGVHGGKPYYARGDLVYYIWWDTFTVSWRLSSAPENIDFPRFDGGAVVEGNYNAFPPATGTATVAAFP